MPASTSAWPRKARPPTGPRRTLRGDSSGVSEVIGFLLTFGILSFMLVMSMVAFGAAAEGAQARAVALHAQSAATRVAGVIVEAAVLAEQQGAAEPSLAYSVELPESLEGHEYVIRLETTGDASPCDEDGTASSDQVCVHVPSLDVSARAPLFAAAAPTSVDICDSAVAGGSIVVLYDDPAQNNQYLPGDTAAGCGAGTRYIFLGEA